MSEITVASTASIDTVSAMHVGFISALEAGEALTVAAPCYIATNGKVYLSVSTQTTISGYADFVGFTPDSVVSGGPVTLYGKGARFSLASSGLTPGAYLWICDSKGILDTVKHAAVDAPVAIAISATDIVVIR